MLSRFRMVAGPNGSGKSTLKRRLTADYAVNFYDCLNADEIYAEVAESGAYSPRISVTAEGLAAFAEASGYDESVKAFVRSGQITVDDDCIRFLRRAAVSSYTVALVTNFIVEEHIRQGASFSQETVFSHPSKLAALAQAKARGFRTYLYFVATDTPVINLGRVESRVEMGGHSVTADKIVARYARSLAQVPAALAHLSRAYFFDNSGEVMRYLAEWNPEEGLKCVDSMEAKPSWFAAMMPTLGGEGPKIAAGDALSRSAAAASREAIAATFAAGKSITVKRGNRVVKVSPDGTETVVEAEDAQGRPQMD